MYSSVSSTVSTVKSFTKMVLRLINGLFLTKTLLCRSVLCEALGGSLFQPQEEGKGRKQTLAYSSTEGFPVSIPSATLSLFTHLGDGCTLHCSTNMIRLGAQCHNMLGSAFLCHLELFQRATMNQRTLLMLAPARF